MQTRFELDTKPFADAAKSAMDLAEKLGTAIDDTEKAIKTLYEYWSGKGQREFQKKFKVFEWQIADIKQGLLDLYDDIVTAEEEYIKQDLENAKKEAGKSGDYS